jgi:hypothetical protein
METTLHLPSRRHEPCALPTHKTRTKKCFWRFLCYYGPVCKCPWSRTHVVGACGLQDDTTCQRLARAPLHRRLLWSHRTRPSPGLRWCCPTGRNSRCGRQPPPPPPRECNRWTNRVLPTRVWSKRSVVLSPCGVWAFVIYRVPCAMCRAPCAMRRVPSAECRAPSAVRRALCAVRRVPSAVRRAPCAECCMLLAVSTYGSWCARVQRPPDWLARTTSLLLLDRRRQSTSGSSH